jgi:hypothetical protein
MLYLSQSQTIGVLMRMERTTTTVFSALVLLCGICRADFKYSETRKVTGGALMGAVKFASVFSKNAKQSMAPTTRTVAVKGNKMREDESDGKIQIIDLEGKRFIEVDPQHKTYSIMTFAEMKAAMERQQQEMQEKMKEEQAKHPSQNANVKITPKFESAETGATKIVLGVPTKELKAKMEMLMESDDPKAQGQQVSTVLNSDQWIAQDVPGYSEVRDFYLKMAKELDWVPGQMKQNMANSNVQLSLAELRKNNIAHVTGMPMITYVSMSMGGTGAQAGATQPAAQQPPPQQPEDNSIPTSASAAVMKGLGGMFKKKQQQQQQEAQATANPASTPGSLMDMETEITSYSSDSLDASLFEPPAGYVQVQKPADDTTPAPHQ